ncbi:hypothetical protein CVIRNUC_002708 [Coccomyxa viridis]|uniref:Uncharacterized protein n=1 Tax=Coccomyxa viridis TaxID=1274662 RepID=A0AAV1HWG2_9CHLO|nr:hypothetical protein CVIRNUC_002708 [Coccomyxa viridis]
MPENSSAICIVTTSGASPQLESFRLVLQARYVSDALHQCNCRWRYRTQRQNVRIRGADVMSSKGPLPITAAMFGSQAAQRALIISSDRLSRAQESQNLLARDWQPSRRDASICDSGVLRPSCS